MHRIVATRVALSLVAAWAALAPGAASTREIVIGQSLGLTGGGSEVAKQYMHAAACHFTAVNKEGGVRGNTLRLVSLDDGGKAEKTLENTRTLLEREGAFALFGYTSAAGAQASFPQIEQQGVPLVGIASGGLGVRDRLYRTVFHVRAGYAREIEGAVDILRSSGLAQQGASYALVYNQDAKSNLGAFEQVMKAKGLPIATSVAIDRNSVDMRSPAADLVKSKAGTVMAITTAKALGALIQELRRQGYSGTIVSSSFAGDPLVREAGPAGAGTIVVHVVPDPTTRTTAIASTYNTMLASCPGSGPPSASGLEGYITARVLVEGLRRAGTKPTREALVTAMESIQKFDLGGVEVNFSPTNHEGLRYVDLLIISKSGKLKK